MKKRNLLLAVFAVSLVFLMVIIPSANAVTTKRLEIDSNQDGETDRVVTLIDYDDDGVFDETIEGDVVKEESTEGPTWSQEAGLVIEGVFSSFLDSLDGIFAFVVILILGIILAWILKFIAVKLLRNIRFDIAMERVGINRYLRSFKGSSGFVGFFIFWYVIAISLQFALGYLGISSAEIIIAPIAMYIQKILLAIVVFMVGLWVGSITGDYIVRGLRRLGVDRWLRPVDRQLKMKQFRILKITKIFIQLFVALVFLQIAVSIIDLPYISNLINTLILFLPNVVIGVAIAIVGIYLGEWVKGFVEKQVLDRSFPMKGVLGNGAKALIIFIAIVMALSQFGIETMILYIAFFVGTGSMLLGLAFILAYGLKDTSLNLGAYYQIVATAKEGDTVVINGQPRGTVKKITAYHTLINTPEGKTVGVPNAKMVDAEIEKNA